MDEQPDRVTRAVISVSWFLTPVARVFLLGSYLLTVVVVIGSSQDAPDLFSDHSPFLAVQGLLVLVVVPNVNRRLATQQMVSTIVKGFLWALVLLGVGLAAGSISMGADPSHEASIAAGTLRLSEALLALSALALLPWLHRKNFLARHAAYLRLILSSQRIAGADLNDKESS